MFVFTAKVTKKRIALGITALGVIICCIACFLPNRDIRYNGDEAMDAMSEAVLKKVRSEEECADYLKELGWELDMESSSVSEVSIPKEFDDVYTEYNKMQQEYGYNLSKYRGKTVNLYKYTITNHPSGESNVCANVLVYKNKIIGGDISSAKLSGFTHGITKISDI